MSREALSRNPHPAKLAARGLIALSAIALLASLVISGPQQALLGIIDAEVRAEELSGTILQLDEVLTMSARMCAATGELSWADRYYHFEPQLDAAIEELIALAPTVATADTAAKGTGSANIALVEMEERAFDLVRQGKREEAAELLHSASYERNKRLYAEGMSKTMADVRGALRGQLASLRQHRATVSRLSGLALLALMITGAALIANDKRVDAETHRLVQIVEQSPVAIMITDTTGRLEYVNSMFTRVTGFARSEAIGENPSLLKSGKTSADEYARLWSTISSGQQWRGEFLNVKRNGSQYWAAATIFPIKDSHERVTGFAGIQEDITTAKRDEEEKERLQAELRRSHKLEAVGVLAGGIAHDFNNILGAILGSAELALRTVPENGKLRRQLQRILEGACRAKNLVKQILVFSREGESVREPVELADVVSEALDLIRASLPAMVEIREDIDPTAGTVLANSTQIHQVVMNLCANAGHAMKASGGVLEVSVGRVTVDAALAGTNTSLREGPYLRLAVKDTGCGMNSATRERLFDPFFTTKNVDEGTGMGLAVVHGVVADHDGAILVRSAPGKGSSFEVYLPLAPDTDLTDDNSDEGADEGSGSVLVIDDEPALVETAAEMLEALGYNVTAVASAIEALGLFSSQPGRFDIVVTDQAMPHMSGTDLAEQIKAIRPDIPIIVASGHSDLVRPETARAHGFHGYVAKPYTRHDLGTALRAALDPNRDHS